MSSEILGGAENLLKGNLGGAWDIKHGYADAYTDLGLARRFGGASAAYSLRDIGAMNGAVVNVRREPHDDDDPGVSDETDFSASQVQGGELEDWVSGKNETTLPADLSPAVGAYSLRKVSEGRLVYTGDYSSDTDSISANTGNLTVTGNNDSIFGKDNVLKIENDGNAAPQIACSNSSYQSSSSGVIEFEYYVPSDHPIVGNFWHIGTQRTSSPPRELAYTDRGVKIVGGAWTTAKLYYGSLYGGSDKPTTHATGGRRLITVLDQRVADGVASTVNGADGDIWYLSSLTIKTYDGRALRVRRNSDNLEVDVHFDSDNKVSGSSKIRNMPEQGGELGDTSSTDFNEFLNEEHEITNTGSNLAIKVNSSVQGTIANQSYNSIDVTVTSMQTSGGAASTSLWINKLENHNAPSIGRIRISLDVTHFDFENGGFIDLQPYADLNGNGSPSYGNAIRINGTGSYSVEVDYTTRQTTQAFRLFKSDVALNDRIAIENLKIESLKTSATVHTWYNQSANHFLTSGAKQLTSTNQPTIANNGLVLDHLLFDGNDDFLADINVTFEGAVSLACVSEKSSNGLYPLSAARQSAANRFFAIQEQEETSVFIARNSASQQITTPSSGTKRLTFTRTNSDTSYSVASMGRSLQTGTNDYGAAPTASLINQVVIGSRETGSSGTPTVSTWNGKIFEAIAYQTDQTSNRFKIESNINNYYGLYNDENELFGTSFAQGGNAIVTPNGLHGFTGRGNNGSGVKTAVSGVQLKNLALDDEVIYISFNAVLGSASPTVSLRKNTLGGDLASDSPSSGEPSIDDGFNAIALVSNQVNTEFVAFHDSTENEFTISDFKVSRIARNGFVETWYDQSGSGNNASQGVASKQPLVVEYGGQARMNNGNAAVKGTRYASNNISFLELGTGVSEPYTMFSSFYTNRSFSLLFGGSNVGATPRIVVNTNGLNPNLNGTDNMGTTSTDTTVDSVVTLFSAENGGNAVLRKNGTQIDILTRSADEDRPVKFLFRHQSDIPRKGLFVDSVIFYGSDKTSEFVEIEDELKLANNL